MWRIILRGHSQNCGRTVARRSAVMELYYDVVEAHGEICHPTTPKKMLLWIAARRRRKSPKALGLDESTVRILTIASSNGETACARKPRPTHSRQQQDPDVAWKRDVRFHVLQCGPRAGWKVNSGKLATFCPKNDSSTVREEFGARKKKGGGREAKKVLPIDIGGRAPAAVRLDDQVLAY